MGTGQPGLGQLTAAVGSAPVQPMFDEEPVRKLSLVRLHGEMAKSFARIGRVAVEGEVHLPQTRPNGRIYFTLQDLNVQLPVSCTAARARRGRAVEGERVAVTGRLQVLAEWGRVELLADEVLPVGAGAVAAMLAD